MRVTGLKYNDKFYTKFIGLYLILIHVCNSKSGFIEGGTKSESSDLFDDHVDLISVLHVQVLGGLPLVKSFSIEKEADICCVELHKTIHTL